MSLALQLSIRFILAALLVSSLLVLTGGCSGIDVASDFDPTADFGRLKTYTWREPAKAQNEEGMVSALTHARICDAVGKTLGERGFPLAQPPASADFQVTYRAAVTREIESVPAMTTGGYGYGWRSPYGGRGYSHAYGTGTDIRIYNRGTLVIDVIDARTQTLVWRGTATGSVDEDASPKEREEKIREAVAKVLELFPPKKDE